MYGKRYEGQPSGNVPYREESRDWALNGMPGDSTGRDWALGRRDGRATQGKRSGVLASYRRYHGDTGGASGGGVVNRVGVNPGW